MFLNNATPARPSIDTIRVYTLAWIVQTQSFVQHFILSCISQLNGIVPNIGKTSRTMSTCIDTTCPFSNKEPRIQAIARASWKSSRKQWIHSCYTGAAEKIQLFLTVELFRPPLCIATSKSRRTVLTLINTLIQENMLLHKVARSVVCSRTSFSRCSWHGWAAYA